MDEICLLLPRAFPGNVTPDIDFTYKAVIQCDASGLRLY